MKCKRLFFGGHLVLKCKTQGPILKKEKKKHEHYVHKSDSAARQIPYLITVRVNCHIIGLIELD